MRSGAGSLDRHHIERTLKGSLLPYSPIAGGGLSGKNADGAWPERARCRPYRNEPLRGAAITVRFINERSLAAQQRFAELARERDLAVVTLATAWTLQHDFVGSTISGATSPEQVDETLSARDRVSRELLYPMG